MKLAVMSSAAVFALTVLADTPLDTSNTLVYAIDTCFSNVVTTADDLALFTSGIRTTGWGTCDTITLTTPDGTAYSLANDAAAAGWAAIPVSGGGWWRFYSPDYGEFTLAVRHSLFGTQGDGSFASPLMLVDDDEVSGLLDTPLTGSEMYYFSFPDESFVSMSVAAGNCLEELGGGLWLISAAADGKLYTSATNHYVTDTETQGADRKLHKNDVCGVAYSGDDWLLRSDDASTLTIVSPSGTETVLPFTGTGAWSMTFDQCGAWAVTLSSEWSTMTARIFVAYPFVMSIR